MSEQALGEYNNANLQATIEEQGFFARLIDTFQDRAEIAQERLQLAHLAVSHTVRPRVVKGAVMLSATIALGGSISEATADSISGTDGTLGPDTPAQVSSAKEKIAYIKVAKRCSAKDGQFHDAGLSPGVPNGNKDSHDKLIHARGFYHSKVNKFKFYLHDAKLCAVVETSNDNHMKILKNLPKVNKSHSGQIVDKNPTDPKAGIKNIEFIAKIA